MAIRTKIEIDGLDTIISQLKTFGTAGEEAARQLQTAIEKINTKKLEEDLTKVRESSDQMVRSLLNFQTLITGTAIGLVAKAVFDFATAGVESAVALERNAAAAGMSAEKFQVLAEAMRNAGGSQEQLNTALRRFTQNVDTQGQEQLKGFADIAKDFIQATGGIGGIAFKTVGDFDKIREAASRAAPVLRDFIIQALPESLRNIDNLFPVEAIAGKLQQMLQASEKFRSEFLKVGFDVPAQNISENLDKILAKAKGTLNTLGITLLGLGGQLKTPEKAFIEFIDAVSKLPTTAQQSEAIIKVFGRSAGPELAKLIREGTASLEELQKFLESKGVIFSKEQLAAAKEANEAFDRLSTSYRSFRDQFGISLSPTFVMFLDSLTKAIADFGKQTKANQDEVNEWWDTIKEIASSENPFATFWAKASSAFKSSFEEFVEGTKQEISLLQRVWEITAKNPNISPLKALVQAYGEVAAKSKQSADEISFDWGDTADKMKFSFDSAGNAIVLNFDEIQKKATTTAQQVQQSMTKWVTPLGTTTAPTAPASMTQLTAGTPPEQTSQTLVAPFQEADNQIRTIWIALTDYIQTSFTTIDLSGLTAKLVQPFTDALPGISQVIQQIQQMIYELMLQIALADAAVNKMGNFGVGGPVKPREFGGAASGGFIRGPGTSTSDSILAWLSDREYVVNAKAVSHYGTSLFNALNSMRLPRDIFGPMPRFAQGGLVPAVATRTPVTLVIDRQSFNMTAGDDTISRLKRYAVASQLSSTGRKPRWVR